MRAVTDRWAPGESGGAIALGPRPCALQHGSLLSVEAVSAVRFPRWRIASSGSRRPMRQTLNERLMEVAWGSGVRRQVVVKRSCASRASPSFPALSLRPVTRTTSAEDSPPLVYSVSLSQKTWFYPPTSVSGRFGPIEAVPPPHQRLRDLFPDPADPSRRTMRPRTPVLESDGALIAHPLLPLPGGLTAHAGGCHR